MNDYKLFMILIGCKPKGRNTEQHDVFFGIAKELRDLVPEIKAFWKGASPLHLDGWRIVNNVDGHAIRIGDNVLQKTENTAALFFLNLGGYKENQFEEFHYKMLTVAPDKLAAAKTAKQTAFFLHTGFKDATAHIDDRYGVDVDDFYEINDILSSGTKEKFAVTVSPNRDESLPVDETHLGYFKLHEL